MLASSYPLILIIRKEQREGRTYLGEAMAAVSLFTAGCIRKRGGAGDWNQG